MEGEAEEKKLQSLGSSLDDMGCLGNWKLLKIFIQEVSHYKICISVQPPALLCRHPQTATKNSETFREKSQKRMTRDE